MEQHFPEFPEACDVSLNFREFPFEFSVEIFVLFVPISKFSEL